MDARLRDLYIQIVLWDRFGWGPRETENLSIEQLRLIFEFLGKK